MIATITDAHRSVQVVERDRPAPGWRQLLIRVDASGICGSDLRLLDLGIAGRVLGHEFTGTVVELGAAAEGFAPGERVCAVPTHSCQRCVACLSGDPINRPDMHYMGTHREGIDAPGSLAEYAVIDAGAALPVPEPVTRDQAAMVEPLAIALKVVERARLQVSA
jgi:(R,R)-butanediol dehydrogenase/meso-butanediol dehydrogenase/diacetyl reductase